MNGNLLEVFDREMRCEYQGRVYYVRDNGSVKRIPLDSTKPKGLDNKW